MTDLWAVLIEIVTHERGDDVPTYDYVFQQANLGSDKIWIPGGNFIIRSASRLDYKVNETYVVRVSNE